MITQAPAAPATAPVESDSPFELDSTSALIADIAKDAVKQTLGENPENPDDADFNQPTPPDPKAGQAPVVREDGATWNATANRWQKPDGSFVEGAPPVAQARPDAAAADKDDEVTLPEGFAAVPKVEGRELATKFRVLDHEGELEVPDLTIEFTANGKARAEPLDKVVRLAERGVYNEEREQAVVATKQESQHVHRQNVELLGLVQQMEQEREQILSSDEAYITARLKHEQANTPEAKLDRERALREQGEATQLYAKAYEVSNTFFNEKVFPAVNIMVEKLPTVTQDELGARLILLTNHLRIQTPDGDTMIPPAKHQAFAQILVHDLIPWAQSLHDERDRANAVKREETDRDRQVRDKRLTDAQIEAQKAKNQLGRKGRPGRGGAAAGSRDTGTRDRQPEKPITSIDDAVQSALDATFAEMGMERPRGS